MTTSIGQLIDAMSIEEIIYHEEFLRLEPEIINGLVRYWKITFNSLRRSEKGWLTFNGQEVVSRYYVYYKLRI